VSVVAAPRPRRSASPSRLNRPAVRETLAIATVLVIIWPALAPLALDGLAMTHDGLIHVQRLIALEAAARHGALLTRWLPDLAYGYGQPLFLYYAPLAYAPALAARLLGAGHVASIEIASGLALVLSALAMYLFARSMVGPLAASVAAIVYAVLPYQLVDLYVRGTLAESWAFVWLPLCAWCLVKAWIDRRPRWSVGLAIALAALVLTHNITALLYLPALLALAFALQLRHRDGGVPRRPVAALAAGLALSAWFWLPAIAERGLVQIDQTLIPELFASFFVRAWPPIRLEPLYDYRAPVSMAVGSPIFWPQLGLVQAVITIAGAVAAVRLRGSGRAVAIWALVLALGSYVLQLRPLAPVYDLVPLLTFVQFPWRLLAILGFGSAILAGLLVQAATDRVAVRALVAAIVVGASLATAVARLDPEVAPIDERLLSIETIGRLELADYGLGTTHGGEYLPVTSGQRNAARFRKTVLDAGDDSAPSEGSRTSALHVERLDWRPDQLVAEVTASAADRLVVHQFAFPGWTARIDDAPVQTSAVGPLGLLAVDVPAGRHVVTLRWGWTPLRALAAAVSVLAVLGLTVLGSGRPLTPGFLPLAGAGVVAALVVATLGPDWSTGRPTGRPLGAAGPTLDLAAESDRPLALVDAQLDASRLAAERLVLGRLVWLARQKPPTGYRATLEATGADGVTHRAPWVYEPLSRLWEPGELAPTTLAMRLPPGFPSGDVQLRLLFERPEEIAPIPIGTVHVPTTSAGSPAPADATSVPGGLQVAGSITTQRPHGHASPGDSVDVALRWAATSSTPGVDRELVVVAGLATPAGEVVSGPRRPGDWFSPLPFWQNGDVIEQRIRLSLPASVPPGTYPLAVRVYARDLARGGASEPGASTARPRGRPVAELSLGSVTVDP
jgi:hypothetical protein